MQYCAAQVEAEGDVATAVTLARILSNIPLSRGGPTSVVIFDIHALQVHSLYLPKLCHACQPKTGNIGAFLGSVGPWRCPSVQSSPFLKTAPLCMLQERFYFGDTVLPLFESGIPLVRERLQSLPDADNITIAYPDEGAWKRFHYQFGDYPEVNPFVPKAPQSTTAG